MPDATLASLRDALEQRFRSGVVARQPNRATTLLNLLPKAKAKAGKNCAWTITVGTDVGVYYDDGEDVAAFSDDTELPAVLEWAELGDSFAITGRTEDAAAGDPTELANVYLKKLRDARNRAAAKINLELISGTGDAGPPQELSGMLSTGGPLDATGIYATVNRATHSQFASNLLANGAVDRAITIDLIQEGFDAAFDASGGRPDLLVASTALWTKIGSLAADDRRLVQNVQTATVRGQAITIDQGYEMLLINGVPIIKDKDWPDSDLVGLNLDHIELLELPRAAAARDRGDILAELPIAGTVEEQMLRPEEFSRGARPLMAGLYKLARTGRKSKFQLVTTCQLAVDRPNAHFRITDLDPAL